MRLLVLYSYTCRCNGEGSSSAHTNRVICTVILEMYSNIPVVSSMHTSILGSSPLHSAGNRSLASRTSA